MYKHFNTLISESYKVFKDNVKNWFVYWLVKWSIIHASKIIKLKQENKYTCI